jgi:RNA polymerase sigma-70 factor (ECF subfamily)
MDLTLIKNCINGDRKAQKVLYEKYKTKMFVLCLRYFKKREDAEDALQDGFVKVFRDLYQFDVEKGTFESWMKIILIRTCLEKLRKKSFDYSDLDDHVELASYDATPVQNLNLEYLTQMIQKLPLGYRTVFNLYVIDGYNHKEIAVLLNISESTSKTQLMKAKNMLKSKIESVFK